VTRGHIFLLVGPSGGGKTTLIRRVVEDGRLPAFTFVPSTTSRAPRPGEADGVDYHFVADAEFGRLLARGDFLEWQRVHGFRYGSSRARLVGAVNDGKGITSADILGAFKIKAALPALVSTVFVTPSDSNRLRQRIVRRAPLSEAELTRRLGRVAMEMGLAHACDRLVLNDELDVAIERLRLCAAAQARASERLAHFGRVPVVRVVEVGPPPRPECGTRFCVADCETPEQAVERVLHQWWWECHPEAVRFDLPEHRVQPTGRQEYVRTEDAVLDVTRWMAVCPDGRPFAEAALAGAPDGPEG
jgi:guanylate kinase